MTLDEAKRYWQSHDVRPESTARDAEVLALVRARSAAFDRTIRRRDRRELIGAALAILLIAPSMWSASWLTRAGGLLVLAGSVLIALKLGRARRRHAGGRADWPVAQVLRAERAKVEAQIGLLESMLWWYIAPLALGVVMIVAGADGASWSTLGYGLFVAAMSAGIYALNQHAVRRQLRPKRDELERLLRQVEE